MSAVGRWSFIRETVQLAVYARWALSLLFSCVLVSRVCVDTLEHYSHAAVAYGGDVQDSCLSSPSGFWWRYIGLHGAASGNRRLAAKPMVAENS